MCTSTLYIAVALRIGEREITDRKTPCTTSQWQWDVCYRERLHPLTVSGGDGEDTTKLFRRTPLHHQPVTLRCVLQGKVVGCIQWAAAAVTVRTAPPSSLGGSHCTTNPRVLVTRPPLTTHPTQLSLTPSLRLLVIPHCLFTTVSKQSLQEHFVNI